MSRAELLIYAIFGLAIFLPLLPGLLELRRGQDDDPLKIDTGYARDPRFLGKSMRNKMTPFFTDTEGEDRVPFLNRKGEFASVVDSLDVGDHSHIDDIVLSRGAFSVGDHSALLDVYAKGTVYVGASSRLRTLAADGNAIFGPGTQVIRWIDVDADCMIGDGSELGQSVTASGRLRLGDDVSFNRLFGRPIVVDGNQRAEIRAMSSAPMAYSKVTDRRRVAALSVDPGTTYDTHIVATGDVEIGEDAVVTGSIKAGGNVIVRRGGRVLRNVVARGNVIVEPDGSIFGHIFADHDVTLHEGALVGERHAPKTLHSLGATSMASGASIFGWLIAERGGTSVVSMAREEAAS